MDSEWPGSWPAKAAENNAAWCDLVCRTHGLPTELDHSAWTSGTRAPAYYPDAVTLMPDPSVPELLARIDVSPGCSVKDSFATLDLTAYGFRVLFDSTWIVRTDATVAPPARSNAAWEVVRDPDGFALWEEVWRGDEGPPDVLRAELVDHDDVAVLAARSHGGEVVAGAILNRSAGVVGISNFFAGTSADPSTWATCAFAGGLHPGAPCVGYETGETLDWATSSGFATAGPLRVWLLEA